MIKKELWVKHQCRFDRGWRNMWSPQSTFNLWKKSFHNLHYVLPRIGMVCLRWNFFLWNSITVLKLLRSLSKSSTSSSDHLNMVFEFVPVAATFSLVMLAILFFIELFQIWILLFCCCSLSIYHLLAHR